MNIIADSNLDGETPGDWTMILDPHCKFYGWTIREGADLSIAPYMDQDVLGRGFLRVHYRVTRTPSKREFVLRHLTGSTIDERARARRVMANVANWFARAEARGAACQHLNRAGRFWIYSVYAGTPLNDPLIQLELEMMIDLHSEVSA